MKKLGNFPIMEEHPINVMNDAKKTLFPEHHKDIKVGWNFIEGSSLKISVSIPSSIFSKVKEAFDPLFNESHLSSVDRELKEKTFNAIDRSDGKRHFFYLAKRIFWKNDDGKMFHALNIFRHFTMAPYSERNTKTPVSEPPSGENIVGTVCFQPFDIVYKAI